MQTLIRNLVVVGGGTAGWMVASSLQKYLRAAPVKITLVESTTIGTVGVGEATIPSIRRFYADLDMSDAQVIKATNATCKLGIRFEGWHEPGKDFFHPFGLFGQDVKQTGFLHFWNKLRAQGEPYPLADYSLATQMALQHKFALPVTNPTSALSIFDWALHFDAGLFADLMKAYALHHGVSRVDSKITQVNLREENGYIESLSLENGETVAGDLFIDCSGFRGVLIEEALKTGYEDWSEWLKCDRAIATPATANAQFAPYTVSRAQSAGWLWRIPLQNRTGNGHVFASRYISTDEATHQLMQSSNAEWLDEPRIIKFQPGRRKAAWNRNCIAVGLSSGFLEPLESTSIAFIENAITRIKMLFPVSGINQACVNEFNEMTRLEFESSRDFLILHYKLNQRHERFWKDCREMEIPQRLQHKIEVFRARGHLVKYRWEIFQNASWLALYNGNEIYPRAYDPFVDTFSVEYLHKAFAEMRQSIQQSVASLPAHNEFLHGIRPA